jgi:tRNA A-37 threonylcarbamoyl transferase component Bud32
MFDPRYLDYSRSDRHYYDRLAGADPADDFPLAHGPVPDGFTRTVGEEWVRVIPDEIDLPGQGWKVHVSAIPGNADEILARTWTYLCGHRIGFKFLRGIDLLVRRNSKHSPRERGGKFIAVYPVDEASLDRVLHGLDAELTGQVGPYVLTDLRWRDGPLYLRYGGFTLQTTRGRFGEPVPSIMDDNGDLVPDVRKPGFRIPDWVTVPEPVRQALEERRMGTMSDFPYRVQRALHFSNGGGVYQGIDTRNQQPVLLKEARPYAGLDVERLDAVARLRREHWALQQLAGLPFAPRLLDLRVGHEHLFLLREYVDGVPLSQLIQERCPMLRVGGVADPAVVGAYARWALEILSTVEQALTAIHDRGIVFHDLHPGNIVVGDQGRLWLIDFETARPAAESPAQAMAAQGFAAPEGCTGVAADWYAFGCLCAAMFLPLTIITGWGSAKTADLVELVEQLAPLDPAYRTRLRANLRLDPARSTSPPTADVRALAAGIVGAATPERDDRLFPGDIRQFLTPIGGLGFAHGAAGVLWALSVAGCPLDPDHLSWLLDRAGRVRADDAGFSDGLSGLAYALDGLRHCDLAAELVDRAIHAPRSDLTADLDSGLAGLGLTLLHFAGRTGSPSMVDEAILVAESMIDITDRYAPMRPGLLRGPAGHALFLLRLYEQTDDIGWLDRAGAYLSQDLALFGWGGPAQSWQHVHGLGGPIGTAMVIHDYVRHREDASLRSAAAEFQRAARVRFMTSAGWYHGRAGTMAGLRYLDPVDETIVQAHATDLAWHLVRNEDLGLTGDGQTGVSCLGEHGFKLSTDLATGSAGVLLSVHTAQSGQPTPVPFFGAASTAVSRSVIM